MINEIRKLTMMVTIAGENGQKSKEMEGLLVGFSTQYEDTFFIFSY